jgi:hypothetical protein
MKYMDGYEVENCWLCQGHCVLYPIPFKTQIKDTLLLLGVVVIYSVGLAHFIATNWN